jgi:dihydrofolate synthase/folylpolyglutamate synthase
MRALAAEREAPLHVVDREVTVRESSAPRRSDGGSDPHLTAVSPEAVYPGLQLGLTGPHQQKNALLAFRAAELLYPLPSAPTEAEERERREAIATGLREVRERAGLRARMELVQEEPPVIVDVAHNAESLEATLDAVRVAHGGEEAALYVLFGVMADKDVSGMEELLAERADGVFPVELSGERALSASDLRARLGEAGVSLVAEEGERLEPTVEAGLAWHAAHAGPEDVLLCAGSHRVVGAVLDLVAPVRTGEEDL